MEYYFLLFAVVMIILLVLLCRKKSEGLSLSQFPVPTCSTCKSCSFYTCGKCGTYYQEQNKIGQACDCGGTVVYRTKLNNSCYDKYLRGEPNIHRIEGLHEKEDFGCDCTDGPPDAHVCLEAAGTFDSGSTFYTGLPCPVLFPPLIPGFEPVAHKQSMHVSELDLYKHLENGGLVIAANKGNIIDYTMKKLQEQTIAAGMQGYPDFYNIEGPVLVMIKVGEFYYWMIDYPVKYNPSNIANYVNRSRSWNVAKTAYQNGRQLLDISAPFIFFSASPEIKNLLASKYACSEAGQAQSNTDYYYPKCLNRTCLWGPDYGDGNWLTRV